MGDLQGHPFRGNQWTSVAGSAKLYAGHAINGRKVAHESEAYIREGTEPTEEFGTAAQVLVDAVRRAEPQEKPLYRGIGADEPVPELEGLRAGDTLELNRLTSFSARRSQAAYYARDTRSYALKSRDVAYEIAVVGKSRSLATDALTGMGHREHLTGGRFRVVRVMENQSAEIPEPDGSDDEMYNRVVGEQVWYKKSIVVEQVEVF